MHISKPLATAGFAFLALAGSHPAVAAPAASTDAAGATTGGALEEIIVTAEKRKENLQDTPISMSVLSASGLSDRHVYSLVDLGDGTIPSLKVAPFFSRPGALITTIRGVGVLSDGNQPARDQGVGIYVDGVYMGRPQGLGTALYDVDSIAVLKGPQGTLFGRNTEGGAVQITTKKPTGKFGLMAKVGVSNFDGVTSEAHFNLPKYANFSVKLDGVFTKQNGWVKNPLAGAEDFGGFDKRAVRARILWEPTDRLTFDYAFDDARDATTTLYQQYLGPTPFSDLPAAGDNTASTSRIDTATLGVPEQESVGESSGHRLTVDWRLTDAVTVRSISAYRDLQQDQWDNGSAALSNGAFAGSPTGNFLNRDFGRYSTALFKQNQFSQEVEIIGETERLKWVAGAIYFSENVSDNARAFATNTFTNAAGTTDTVRQINYFAQRIDRASSVNTKSTGVFGQATYTPPVLEDALHVTLGGRWTKDEKTGKLNIVNGFVFPANSAGQVFNVGGTPIVSPNLMDASWDRFDPIINVAYDVSKDVMVYAKYSSGYKSGGSNSRSLTYRAFNPETVDMAEIGTKIELFDRRLRLNLAAYDGKYNDIQLDFSAPYLQANSSGVLVATNRTTTETVNATGEGKLKGFEAELMFAATDNLTLSASYAYNKVDIPATLNPFPQSNGALITVPIPIYPVYTPENSASFAADYERPFMGAKLVGHIDGNYGDGFYQSFTDFLYNADRSVKLKNTKGDSSFVVNGRISIAEIPVASGLGTISLWSRNLFDEEHVFYKGTSNARQGYGGFYNEPRTFGVEFAVKM